MPDAEPTMPERVGHTIVVEEPPRGRRRSLDFSLAADGHQIFEAADIAKTSFEGSFSRRLTEARWAGWSVGRAGRRPPRDLQDAMLKSY